jgi:predicted phage gp36 major capsid-like protein
VIEELREELKNKVKQIEESNRNETQEVRRVKQENSELNLIVKESRTLVAEGNRGSGSSEGADSRAGNRVSGED